jgi:type II secretory pathway pseudopilin PulG
MGQKGFSILELTIVVLIIAALIGAIAGGGELIGASERNRLVGDIQKYSAAYRQFINKYESIPGDMYNAESVFGSANTDNGNGDGVICPGNSPSEDCNPGQTGTQNETYLAWQHLGLANLINFTFSGTRSSAVVVLGTDIPTGPYKNSGYRMYGHAPSGYASVSTMVLGKLDGGGSDGNQVDEGVLTPQEAETLDKKIDDGQIQSGQFLSWNANTTTGGGCYTGSGPYLYKYDNQDKDCMIYYKFDKADKL